MERDRLMRLLVAMLCVFFLSSCAANLVSISNSDQAWTTRRTSHASDVLFYCHIEKQKDGKPNPMCYEATFDSE
jgi:hypothetical protein